MSYEYGIVANVDGPDHYLRLGSKAWVMDEAGCEGWSRFLWIGRTRGGRLVQKWAPAKRFANFRCAWIPKNIRRLAGGHLNPSGTRREMEALAIKLNYQKDNSEWTKPDQGSKPTD